MPIERRVAAGSYLRPECQRSFFAPPSYVCFCFCINGLTAFVESYACFGQVSRIEHKRMAKALAFDSDGAGALHEATDPETIRVDHMKRGCGWVFRVVDVGGELLLADCQCDNARDATEIDWGAPVNCEAADVSTSERTQFHVSIWTPKRADFDDTFLGRSLCRGRATFDQSPSWGFGLGLPRA